MDFVAWPLANVTARLADYPRSIQNRFQEIMTLLLENPYPNPRFPTLTEERTPGSATVYTYSDRSFPLSIQYMIVDPTEVELGMIIVFDVVEKRR